MKKTNRIKWAALPLICALLGSPLIEAAQKGPTPEFPNTMLDMICQSYFDSEGKTDGCIAKIAAGLIEASGCAGSLCSYATGLPPQTLACLKCSVDGKAQNNPKTGEQCKCYYSDDEAAATIYTGTCVSQTGPTGNPYCTCNYDPNSGRATNLAICGLST